MNVKNFVLGIGIVIVYALMLWQGIEAFYPSPQYDDFCDNVNKFRNLVPGTGECDYPEILHEQEQQCYEQDGRPIYDYDDAGCAVGVKECDYCSKKWDNARDDYSQRLFVIALIVGLITFIVGFSILKIEPVGSALIGSGIWAVFYGSVWNWRNFSNIWRFLLLALVFVLLIWFTIRLNRVGKKKKKGFFKGLFGKK